jgi:hypothetical protein
MPLRPSFLRTSSRLARVAVGVCSAVPLTLMVVVTAGIEPPADASSAHVGPVYPAPGSGKLTTTGAEGQTGGVTFSFSKVKTKKFKSMVWGLWYPKYPATWSFGLNTETLGLRQHGLQPRERRSRLLGRGGVPQSGWQHPNAAYPARRAG